MDDMREPRSAHGAGVLFWVVNLSLTHAASRIEMLVNETATPVS